MIIALIETLLVVSSRIPNSDCLEQKGISWPLELENPGVEPPAWLDPGALVVLSGFVPLSFGLAIHQISFILCGSPKRQGLLPPFYTEDKLGPKKVKSFIQGLQTVPRRDPGFEPTAPGSVPHHVGGNKVLEVTVDTRGHDHVQVFNRNFSWTLTMPCH